jgi:hypothetical protein
MTYNKIAYGYVVQEFNDQGTCLNQRFVADNGDVVYECVDENGHVEEINMADMPFGGNEYFCFAMVQPLNLNFN